MASSRSCWVLSPQTGLAEARHAIFVAYDVGRERIDLKGLKHITGQCDVFGPVHSLCFDESAPDVFIVVGAYADEPKSSSGICFLEILQGGDGLAARRAPSTARSSVRRTATGLHRSEDVGVELGGLPADGGTDFFGGEAEGAAEVGTFHVGAVHGSVAQDSSRESGATQISVAEISAKQNSSLELSAAKFCAGKFCAGEIGLFEICEREFGVLPLNIAHIAAGEIGAKPVGAA
jgi:hypothetical protein